MKLKEQRKNGINFGNNYKLYINMNKAWENTKHFFRMIKYIFGVAFKTLKDRRTWLIVAFIVWSYLLAYFNANYYTQSPVKEWQRIIVPRQSVKPIKNARVAVKKQVVEVKKPTYTAEYENAYDTVHFNESNRGNDKSGLNGECLAKGLVNEIGYAPHDHFCFKNREEQKATFMLWLKNRLEHKKMPYCNTIRECILFYTNSAYTI